MKKPEVKIVLAETHRIKAGDKLFVTIDPAFADYAEGVENCLKDLGAADAIVFPIFKDAIKFYAIEQTINVTVDPKLKELGSDVKKD